MDKFDFSPYKKILNDINPVVKVGKVVEIIGLIIEADGPESSIGDLCHIVSDDIEPISCEVVGFRENRILLMPLGSIEGLKAGAKVVNSGSDMKVKVSDSLLGRVLDGLGNPIDGLGEIAADK